MGAPTAESANNLSQVRRLIADLKDVRVDNIQPFLQLPKIMMAVLIVQLENNQVLVKKPLVITKSALQVNTLQKLPQLQIPMAAQTVERASNQKLDPKQAASTKRAPLERCPP